MSKFRIYIDEVGNSDLNSSSDPNHRFLSLTGVIFDLRYVSEILNPEIENLKKKYFNPHPDEALILHRKEIMNKKPPFESFAINQQKEVLIKSFLHYSRNGNIRSLQLL